MPRLTVKQAAAYIPCGVSTLSKLRVSGGGPRYSKPAGRVLYDTKHLDAWVERNTYVSTSDEAAKRRERSHTVAQLLARNMHARVVSRAAKRVRRN